MASGAGGASILHADLDAFYASVEQVLDPTLQGLPIAVGGGVVLAASYEARRWGVRSGMAGGAARKLCPTLRFVGGHFEEYQRLGEQVCGIFYEFTPLVERVSIDEAFLDVTGSVHLFGPPAEIAARIRDRVRIVTGLAVSVGVARTKHLAKVASQVAKPDGLVVVEPHDERRFLDPLPVGLVWGVGPVTEARLASLGINTIGDLARTAHPILEQVLGTANGAKLASLSNNIDGRRVSSARKARSVGAQSAFGRRDPSPAVLQETLGYLADRVGGRLRSSGRAGRTVNVRVRFADMQSVTRSTTERTGVSSTLLLTDIAVGLVVSALADHPGRRQISLLGVSVSNLIDSLPAQLELALGGDGFRDAPEAGGVDRSVDAIRSRFGRQSIGYASVLLSRAARVPEGFRELAER